MSYMLGAGAANGQMTQTRPGARKQETSSSFDVFGPIAAMKDHGFSNRPITSVSEPAELCTGRCQPKTGGGLQHTLSPGRASNTRVSLLTATANAVLGLP